VRSRALGVWIRAVQEGARVRLRLATGARGEDVLPSDAEVAAAEQLVRRIAEAQAEAEREARRAAEAALADELRAREAAEAVLAQESRAREAAESAARNEADARESIEHENARLREEIARLRARG
jgi:fused signal recognition particle receptor